MLTNKQLAEVKAFVKKVKKVKKEGSTTAGAPGFNTPKAFTGDEEGDGTTNLKRITRATGYEIKAKKTRNHSIDLHEVSYRDFKKDESRSTVKKVNESIIEINRRLREINRLLSHSSKLKTESSLDDSVLWKKTNEALLKISDRMTEIASKTRKFANIKEIQTNVGIENTFKAAGLKGKVVKDDTGLHVDVDHFGEPVGFDIEGTKIIDDTGQVLGDLNDQDIVDKLKQYFNA
tara:strand:- start:632 stop:1330 length:699 start_codon:yes stop_codon:yes gene_type:complete